jgi:hypothetical protein
MGPGLRREDNRYFAHQNLDPDFFTHAFAVMTRKAVKPSMHALVFLQ